MEVNLLKQVIEQGKNLQNSILETILKNDPYYLDNIPSADVQSLSANRLTSNLMENKRFDGLSIEDKHKFLAYIKGENMTLGEEKEALNTFRALSTNDLCEITAKSYKETQISCDCDTCKSYYKHNFETPLVPPLNLKTNRETVKGLPTEGLQYADSLKVKISSLKLNLNGQLKVENSLYSKNSKYPLDLTTMYFVEYCIPTILRNKSSGDISKVDSGLRNNQNIVRHCSKRKENNVINFQAHSVHTIRNLQNVDKKTINLTFKITCRAFSQRVNNVIGFATFNFDAFSMSSTLSCNQELDVYLSEDSPVIVAKLKVILQLGYQNLYFGKQFLESLRTRNTNSTVDSDDSSDNLQTNINETFIAELKSSENTGKTTTKSIFPNESKRSMSLRQNLKNLSLNSKRSTKDVQKTNTLSPINTVEVKTILFGFIYISEVEYLENRNYTYFTCQPFCQNDLIFSNILSAGARPYFNYYQIVPFVYNDEFLLKLRDNFMVLEFFEKLDFNDTIIGLSKVPLHQYYLAFRNPTIVKYLQRNNLPVIGSDWFEPITHPKTDEITGQVQILAAIGTEEQIQNLQKERGFKDNIVTKAKKIILKSKKDVPPKTIVKETKNLHTQTSPTSERIPFVYESPPICISTKKSTEISKKLIDKSTQKFETIDKGSQSNNITVKMNDKSVETLQNYLQQLSSNSQSTETIPNDIQEKSTVDLLDSLQNALCVDSSAKKDTFRARINVESALHLPSRKKCKARRVNGKLTREEIKPSTYVSFETHDGIVKTSQVVQKTSSPLWNLQGDVNLSTELLTNSNKKLIFKVWIKSNNGSTIPNMEIDNVLGFVAVDLTVLSAGLPTIDGWYNIMDFSGNCKGQTKIRIAPLETVSKFKKSQNLSCTNTNNIPNTEEPTESLSRALKRKFIELDEITQRLKSRLSEITTEQCETEAETSDPIVDEFENDINTLCVEDDYDMLNFGNPHKVDMDEVSDKLRQTLFSNEEGALQFAQSSRKQNPTTTSLMKPFVPEQNVTEQISDNSSIPDLSTNGLSITISSNLDDSIDSQSSDLTNVDQQLTEGKAKIDSLLKKLSLAHDSNEIEPFTNRYVSGCSVVQESNVQEEIFSELGIDNGTDKIFDSILSNINDDLKSFVSEDVRDSPDGGNGLND